MKLEFIKDNLLKNITVAIGYDIVCSLHISLLLSHNSEQIISDIQSAIPYYKDYSNVIIWFLILLMLFCYIDLYKYEIQYISYSIDLADGKVKPNVESDYHKRIKAKSLICGYLTAITYLVSLLEYYKFQYIKFYLVIFFFKKIVDFSVSSIAQICRKINLSFLSFFYLLGFAVSCVWLITDLL